MEQQDQGRADQPAGQQLQRLGEEEPEDQRQLAHRDGVRLALELHVEDERLGGGEAEGQGPPGQRDRGVVGARPQQAVPEHRGEGELYHGHAQHQPGLRGGARQPPAARGRGRLGAHDGLHVGHLAHLLRPRVRGLHPPQRQSGVGH